MGIESNTYKFIDLFAGLGGFHFALEQLGCECVFASEIKEDLRKLYTINFPGCRIEGDITKISPEDIPAHDILCAGFPCQPFSQAGKRQGFNDDKKRGNLFDNICNILMRHRPRYVILENVSNLKGHDNGNTWNTIFHKLSDSIEDGGLNYEVLLLPYDSTYSFQEMADMVKDVNEKCVPVEEQLSNQVYYYSSTQDSIFLGGDSASRILS